jgi:hypothetical protein
MPDDNIDYRAHPEHYRIGRGEAGVFHIQPYKGELLPLWTIRTPDLARESADAILAKYRDYRAAGDFVGMDMARKYLQMGFTRARRYANRKGGRKRGLDGEELPRGTGDPAKAEVAEIFRAGWREVTDDPEYQRLKAQHQRLVKHQPRHPGTTPTPE